MRTYRCLFSSVAIITASIALAVACGSDDNSSDHKDTGGTGGKDSGTGGSSATGGQGGTGGSSATGGQGGTGGSAASGGQAGSGGSAGSDAAAGSKLTLSLDATIDGDGDTVKATSITSAILLSTAGTTVASATISGGDAVFSLAGVTAGDYFINVNADADDLVPTRIDDPSVDVNQRVGQKLRESFIGPVGAPAYHINTYSAGQGQGPAVKFSDGTPIAGEQPYVIVTLGTPKIEFRVLGTAALLSTTTPTMAMHPANSAPFHSWLLNMAGLDHHGDMFMADGGASGCGMCHQNMANKPATHDSINPTDGWCYRCHNGTDGDGAGFFDSTK